MHICMVSVLASSLHSCASSESWQKMQLHGKRLEIIRIVTVATSCLAVAVYPWELLTCMYRGGPISYYMLCTALLRRQTPLSLNLRYGLSVSISPASEK